MSFGLSREIDALALPYRERMPGVARLLVALDDAVHCEVDGTVEILYEGETKPRDDEHVIPLAADTIGLGAYNPIIFLTMIADDHSGKEDERAFDAACSRAADDLNQRILSLAHTPGQA